MFSYCLLLLFYYDHKIIYYVVFYGKHLLIPDLTPVTNFFILSDTLSFLLYSVKNCMLSWFLHLFYFWSQNSVNIFLFKVCHILFFCFVFFFHTHHSSSHHNYKGPSTNLSSTFTFALLPIVWCTFINFPNFTNHLFFKTLRSTLKTISQIHLIT